MQEDFGGTIAYGMFDEFGYKEVAVERKTFSPGEIVCKGVPKQQLLELRLFFGAIEIRVTAVVFIENMISFK